MNLLLKYTALFFIYLCLQVFVANHFTLFDVATPHIFLVFLLMLPMNTRFPLALAIAFLSGLILDLLSDGLVKGLHAFSGVFVISIRAFWVLAITNQANYTGREDHVLQVQSLPWYVQYLGPLVFIHQAVYYMLEAFSFDNLPHTLMKVLASSVFTFLVVFVFTLLFHRETKR